MPVNTDRKDVEDIRPKWARLRNCFDGRDAVLKAGALYVPDLPAGDTNSNTDYRKRGNFYNAVSTTVKGMAGAIFQKAPEVEFPEAIKDFLDDITLTNVPFESFATDAGREIVLMGRFGVLVDMPQVLPGATVTPGRPYLIGYRAENIINWRTARHGGDEVLTMVILHETEEVPDDKDRFIAKIVPQYRVVELVPTAADAYQCVQSVYRLKEENTNEYQQVGDTITMMRRGVPLDFVPFYFMGAIHPTPDLESPPLIDLADVNLGHWRNSVDHEYGLHLVALPTPWVSGARSGGDQQVAMKIGPSVVWDLELQGSAGMLEFTGSGLASLVTAMDEKKKQMATLGARLLENAPQGTETATAVRMRHSGEHASIRTMAGSIELGFTLILQTVAWWVGVEDKPVDVEANVELNKEYLDIRATPQEIQVALTALQAGEISFETWWELLTTGGWGREGIDAAAERLAIEQGKSVTPEPPIDPTLSPGEPKPPIKKKTITGPDGVVKYVIEEQP